MRRPNNWHPHVRIGPVLDLSVCGYDQSDPSRTRCPTARDGHPHPDNKDASGQRRSLPPEALVATGYDWRGCEARLNALPQFVTNLDELDLHFVHVKSPHETSRPHRPSQTACQLPANCLVARLALDDRRGSLIGLGEGGEDRCVRSHGCAWGCSRPVGCANSVVARELPVLVNHGSVGWRFCHPRKGHSGAVETCLPNAVPLHLAARAARSR